MNERIEKLVIEAFFDESTNGADQKMYTLGEDKIQKFAELIVRECADILDPNSAYAEKYKHAHVSGPDGLRTPLSTTELENMLSAQKLREHFGVKE